MHANSSRTVKFVAFKVRIDVTSAARYVAASNASSTRFRPSRWRRIQVWKSAIATSVGLDPPPPVLRFVQRCLHRKWLLKPPLISHNMHKFRQHLRRDRHPVPWRQQFREQAQGICMMRVLYDLDGQEEACIQAMRHRRLPDSCPADWVCAPTPLRAVLCR